MMKFPEPSPETKRGMVKFFRQTSLHRLIEQKRQEAEERKKQEQKEKPGSQVDDRVKD